MLQYERFPDSCQGIYIKRMIQYYKKRGDISVFSNDYERPLKPRNLIPKMATIEAYFYYISDIVSLCFSVKYKYGFEFRHSRHEKPDFFSPK
jgi:hypothetical protein